MAIDKSYQELLQKEKKDEQPSGVVNWDYWRETGQIHKRKAAPTDPEIKHIREVCVFLIHLLSDGNNKFKKTNKTNRTSTNKLIISSRDILHRFPEQETTEHCGTKTIGLLLYLKPLWLPEFGSINPAFYC